MSFPTNDVAEASADRPVFWSFVAAVLATKKLPTDTRHADAVFHGNLRQALQNVEEDARLGAAFRADLFGV